MQPRQEFQGLTRQMSSIRPSAAVSRRARTIALAGLSVVQFALLAAFFPRPPTIESDNTRYEEAGYNLASGRGLSLSYSNLADADVREWACTRHPERCTGETYPTASYPPGYQVFIACIFSLMGRSLTALLLAQGILHLAMMLLLERIAFVHLNATGYWFVLLVGGTYPFLARQAGMVMSDHLHAVVLFAAIALNFSQLKPKLRAFGSGLLLAFATLTRPYSLVALPFLLFIPAARRSLAPSRSALALFLVGLLGPFAAWITRNAETYGRFIPLTTTGLGAALYLNKTEISIGSSLVPGNALRIYDELKAVGGGDITTWRANHQLRDMAVQWMLANPEELLVTIPKRIPRVWISMGFQGEGIHPLAAASIVYLGGLLILGVLGMFRKREGPWLLPLIIVLAYWAFLLHTPGEARRSLALRLPMLLFAGAAIDASIESWRRRRDKRVGSSAAKDPAHAT